MTSYTVLATDGEAGKIDDLYFDEKTWGTAYAAVRIGSRIGGRRVFLPPTALGKPDWEREEFPVAYSKRQVMNSPDFAICLQAFREDERRDRNESWIPIWMPSPDVGLGIMMLVNSEGSDKRLQNSSLEEDDPHLRSANAVMGCRVHATDGTIGHVSDLLVDDSTWTVCYLVVSTSRWMPRRRVLITPQSVNTISRVEGLVYVDLTIRKLKSSLLHDSPMSTSQGTRGEVAEVL